MIDELNELTRVVNRHKISHISLLDAGFLNETQNTLTQLYNTVADHATITDEEAKILVYGESAKSEERYRKLKSRLRRRLLNTIFVIDSEEKGGYSDYQKAYINCHKDLALVRLLQAYGCRTTSINLAKELLKASEKWQFTDIIMMASQFLSTVSAFNGSTRQQSEFRNITETAQRQYFDELQCQMDFDEVIAMVNRSAGNLRKMLPFTRNKYLTIRDTASHYPGAFRIQLLEKRMAFVVAELSGDINKILDSCEDGERLINNNPNFYQASFQAEFVLNHMLCYLRLKNYKPGIAYYQRTRELLQPESGHFLTLQYYYILSLIHAGRYEEAAISFNNASEHTRFKSQARPMQVRWRLMEAALNFISREGLIKNTKLKSLQGKAFTIYKLINDIGSFAEDKAGVNMVLQSLHIAFLIQEGKYKKVTDLQGNFYTYISRHLKNNDNQSAMLFMRMLNVLISTNYNMPSAAPKIKELYKKLEELPPSLSQDVTIDVLPYTWLWQAIVRHSNKY